MYPSTNAVTLTTIPIIFYHRLFLLFGSKHTPVSGDSKGAFVAWVEQVGELEIAPLQAMRFRLVLADITLLVSYNANVDEIIDGGLPVHAPELMYTFELFFYVQL